MMPSRKYVRTAPTVPIETGKARATGYGAPVSDRLFMYGSDDGREVIMPSAGWRRTVQTGRKVIHYEADRELEETGRKG